MTIAVSAIGYGLVNYWLIKQIECSAEGESIPSVCGQLDSLKNKSIFFTNLDQSLLYSQVLKNEQGQAFQPTAYRKVLPGTLKIEFAKKNPSYRLQFGQKTYLANAYNFLSNDDQQFKSLPVIVVSRDYQEKIDPPRIDAEFNQELIDLITTAEQHQLIFYSIEVNGRESVVNTKNWRFKFEYEQSDWNELLAKIKVINNNLDSNLFDQDRPLIDMSFNLPILKSDAVNSVQSDGQQDNSTSSAQPKTVPATSSAQEQPAVDN
mgnify:CR=1 FL=1